MLLIEGKFDAAIPELTEAIRFNPHDDHAPNNYGSVLALTGQRDAAIAEFKQAIRLNPDLAVAHSSLV